MEVSEHVSPVAVIPEVRERLVKLQQEFGRIGGIVMYGRDIGTTVFPHADMKVFVNASAEERARRRQKELEDKTGKPVDYAEILSNIRERDHIDSTREVSPLRQADDAVLLDNDDMNHQQQMQWLMDLYNSIVNK